MKKKLIATMLMMVMAFGVTACGQETEPTNDTVKESAAEPVKEEKETEVKEDKDSEAEKEEELPNWVGVYAYEGDITLLGGYGVNIAYPSLRPANGGCAYQMDPALVWVCGVGYDENGVDIKIENVEDTFMASIDRITFNIEDYRGAKFSDFNFEIENQEVMTINDMPTCMYEGTHTYVTGGETYEIPFVAYSFYTGQIENYSYMTAIVMDDSINHPSMEPLPEGTIEAYARKMVESVKIKEK